MLHFYIEKNIELQWLVKLQDVTVLLFCSGLHYVLWEGGNFWHHYFYFKHHDYFFF